MKKDIFQGSATALVTPFRDGKVDYSAFARILEEQKKNGTAALVVCGTTGEPSTMSTSEQAEVVRFVVEQSAGVLPVIAGTGGNNTADVIEKAKRYQDLGVDAQLCVSPYYNKTTQAGLLAHYTAIADATALPVITYNVPGRTGLNMLPSTVAQLSQHPHVVGHKEANPDLAQASELFRLLEDEFAIYSGCDELVLPFLALGAKGVISVASNLLPQKMANICKLFFTGEWKKARDLQLSLLPFIHAIFKQTSPSPIKAAMQMQGLCEEEVRLPLIPLNEDEKSYLKKIVESLL